MAPTDDIRIVRARAGDGEGIIGVQRLAFAPAAERYRIPDLPPLLETADEVEDVIAGHTVLVALDASGAIVGSVRGEERDGRVYVGRLIVHPGFQRQGIGMRLMVELEKLFPDARDFELFTGSVNEPGMGLYLKLGYAECRRERVTDLLEFAYMRKPGPAVRARQGPRS